MPKSSRFFEIIQILRGAKRPLLAQDLAESLEVSRRTIYRDVASLQAMKVPIVGEAGVGYVLRGGYDLPPLNFDIEEAEAISVGLSMIARAGDPGLWNAAQRAARKLNEAAPGTHKLVASAWGTEHTPQIDMRSLRRAIRDETKLRMTYRDTSGARTDRIVWPLVLIYYVDAALVVAWCELRGELRHFRLDRIEASDFLQDAFTGQGDSLVSEWENTLKHEVVLTRAL